MSGRSEQDEQDEQRRSADAADVDELSERISEALEPTLSDVRIRVAEAVAKGLSDSSLPDQVNEQSSDDTPSRKVKETGSANDAASKDDSSERSFFGQAAESMKSSFMNSLLDEGGEQLESLVDTAVDMIFTRSTRGKVRALADHALQAVLHDILSGIDDPNERIPLYQDSLTRLRPVVRDAVDAMFTNDAKRTLHRQLRAAVPSVVHGDFSTAFDKVTDALSEITDHAEAEIWNNSTDILRVVQKISTELLEEAIEDAVEDRVDPDDIQQRVQDKADEAREKLQETVGALQDGVRSAQDTMAAKTGGRRNRSGGGLPPTGSPPGRFPPSGMPPSGMPPSGLPPSGRPPSGMPPNGLHPAVQRMNRNRSRYSRNPRRRRLPEA